jgi:hypothetical protein
LRVTPLSASVVGSECVAQRMGRERFILGVSTPDEAPKPIPSSVGTYDR